MLVRRPQDLPPAQLCSPRQHPLTVTALQCALLRLGCVGSKEKRNVEAASVYLSPDWGLPTVGPFALKLLAWLELAGISYERVVEANPRKGPKGKNPWIEMQPQQ